MRVDAQAPTIRLADYRPPAYLADAVELTFVLDPAATRVRARVSFRRNPARADEGPLDLRLDGRNLRLVSAAIDGTPVPQNAIALDEEGLTVPAEHVPQRLYLGGRDRDRARAEHGARGALHVARDVLHPVRGAGLPQDHLLARPTRRDGAPFASVWRATCPCCSPTAISSPPAPAGPSGRTRSASPPTSSRWSRANSWRWRTTSPRAPGGRCCCKSGSAPATRTAAPTPWTR